MIVLASSSPRRTQLLDMLGIPHAVEPPEIDERQHVGETPAEAATRLARTKALAIARRRPADHVLGADTIVVIGGEPIGKPGSAAEAEAMLSLLQGAEHEVVTAVALAHGDQIDDRLDVTRVRFRPLDAEMVRAYVATGEPLDKAGAYGIQGFGAVLIERIDGDFFGVMGLPLRHVVDLLEGAGRPYRFTR